MNKTFSIVAACILILFLFSCSKKTTPADSGSVLERKNIELEKKSDSALARRSVDSIALVKRKAAAKAKAKAAAVPKVITVNDASAKRTVDGRLYYDLQGKRYWRNNKDGKYYLYNVSMQDNEDFKAPKKSR